MCDRSTHKKDSRAGANLTAIKFQGIFGCLCIDTDSMPTKMQWKSISTSKLYKIVDYLLYVLNMTSIAYFWNISNSNVMIL